MIALVPYQPWHAGAIIPQLGQDADTIAQSARLGETWAIADERNRQVYFIGGLGVSHADHATAWSVYARDKRRAARLIARSIRGIVHEGARHFRRLDTIVRDGDAAAERFVRWLGFEREAVLRRYFPDGGDMAIWTIPGGDDGR